MYCVSKLFLETILKEDVPYLDLTTELLGIGNEIGKISFTARHNMILAGSEEVVYLGEFLNLKTVYAKPSGRMIEKGSNFLALNGPVYQIHSLWKVALNILEYTSGIATYSRELLKEGQQYNKDFFVVSTRKHLPNTKELTLKGVLSGGVYPHRLGLSETILVFDHHRIFLKESLKDKIYYVKKIAPEKKIIIEASTKEEALEFSKMSIDGIQLDKIPIEDLKELVRLIKEYNNNLLLIATGGINIKNIGLYAQAGVDGVVTSSMYFCKPSDIKVDIEPL